MTSESGGKICTWVVADAGAGTACSYRGRQVVRVLTVLRELECAHWGRTLNELNRRFPFTVSERTLQRDLEHLQAAGFPVEHEEGRFFLRDTTAHSLRHSQTLSLLLAEEMIASLHGSAIHRELTKLRDSLQSRLTERGRTWLEHLRQTMLTSMHASDLELPGTSLEAVQEALVTQQVLLIEHAEPNQPLRSHVAEPHLLCCQGENPFMVAFCRNAACFRPFFLKHLRNAQLLDEFFDQRPHFDPDEYLVRIRKGALNLLQ